MPRDHRDPRLRAVPPRVALGLLWRRLPADQRDMVAGDLAEVFARRVETGRRFNRIWFWTQVLGFLLGFALAAPLDTPNRRRLRMTRLPTGIHHAARRLVFEWRYALGIVLILAVGIGPAAAMLSIVQRVLLAPLDYRSPERLALVRITMGQLVESSGLSMGEIRDLRSLTGVFDEVEGESRPFEMSIGPADRLESVSAINVTPGMLAMLGVRPVVGRALADSDATPQGGSAAMLDYAYWQSHFGGSPAIVGQRVQLNNGPVEIAGVLPPGFMVISGRGTPRPFDVYLPFQVTDFRNFWGYPTIVRLAPGVSVDQANERLRALAAALAAKYPQDYSDDSHLTFRIAPLKDDMVRETRPALRAALTGVFLLLLVAFANAAALIVARLRVRERDLSIRVALGADRAALVSDALIESVLLALCGAAVGALLAAGGVEAARHLVPHTVPRWQAIAVGWDLVADAALLSAAGLMLGGLISVWRVSRSLPFQALRGGRFQAGRGERARSRLILVGAQVALTVVLAFGAVQLVRSAKRLAAVDLGFDPAAMTFRVPIDLRVYNTPVLGASVYERVRDRLQALPGVQAVGASSHLPLSGAFLTDAWSTDLTKSPGWDQPLANYYSVLPGYFAALRIPVRQGRDFTDVEDRTGQPVIVVDDLLARQAFPGVANVTGRILRLGWGIPDSRIVGVVGHVRGIDIREESKPQIYAPFGTFRWPPLNFAVRGGGNGPAFIADVQSAVRDLHTGRAVTAFAMLDDNVEAATSTLHSVTELVTILAVSGGLLSAIGLYTVVAFILHQRRLGTAIRSALGASPAQLMRFHVKTSGAVVLAALPIGLAAAVAIAPLFNAIIFGIGERDATSLIIAAVTAAVAAGAGIYVPVRRAAATDPILVLRGE